MRRGVWYLMECPLLDEEGAKKKNMHTLPWIHWDRSMVKQGTQRTSGTNHLG